ncbi:MAG TPA: helix-turn-helix transcriptional regulator [Frateuria sp.]|uniref:ArsR/SmtB family transcription factor n=1 Tax=Frateuria sp. TaxID=2211372 RepID=UPI002DF54DFD|nr:helix-turn-helix transcriptional regulator [Frateuria sp.]
MTQASLTPHQLAEFGSLLAEPARAAMLLALVDGTARPAGELAQAAGIGAPTASAHLKRLLEGGLLAVQAQGRHRYYRLASDEVAGWLEALALPRRNVAPPTGDAALRRARSCYRHLAGQLGVALCAGLLERGHLATTSDGLMLAPAGAAALADAGLDPAATRRLPDLRGRGCLDWTERRLHLGGPLGVALTGALLEAGWLRHATRGRALLPSAEGLRRFGLLGVRLPG